MDILNRPAFRSLHVGFFLAALCAAVTTPSSGEIDPPPPCSILVDSTNDQGPGSLRDAIHCANTNDTITFNLSGCPCSITLTSGELVVTKNLTILGPGPGQVAINGNGASRVFHISSNLVVTIAGLTMTNGNFGVGAGIFNDHSDLTVSNCIITGNVATQAGAIENFGGNSGSATLTVVDSALIGNTASPFGGAILSDGIGAEATLTVRNSIISHNHASDTGGGILSIAQEFGTATVTIENSTISSNTANEAAGIMNNGAFDGNASVTIINSTIAGNTAASFFGAIWNDGEQSGNATLTIRNSTISGNFAGIVHYSILNDAANSGSATLDIGSTIFQVDAGMTNIHNDAGDVVSQGYNLSSDNSSTFLNQSTDQNSKNPLLGPLQDNGGRTLTRALLCGSPAINAGANPLALLFDQRGESRTAGSQTDVGAYELQLASHAYIVTTNGNDGAGSLRQAILDANACPGKDTITFAQTAYGTITLTNGELLITDDLDIFGPGATNVVVSGNEASRVFRITPHLEVSISGLTITKGVVQGLFGVGSGGGIYCDNSTLTVSNCTIFGNSAEAGGGGILNLSELANDTSTVTVVSSCIASNSSGSFGGGIESRGFNDGGSVAILNVANSTFSGNHAVIGGGIYNGQGFAGNSTVTIDNCTFRDNTASDEQGGGINNTGGTAIIGSTIFDNSIFTKFNTAPTSLGYNLSSDDGSGFLNQPTDQTNTPPLLGPLQLNGGQTPTHAFTCASPAADNGSNFAGTATDQTGAPRTVGGATDVGAFELQQICNQAPIARCTNVTVSASTNDCTADASIDNGSSDPDGDPITVTQIPPGPYSLGENSVTLVVADNHNATNTCPGTITVEDTTPPTVTCPGNITKTNDAGQCTAVVNFIVSASDACGGLSGNVTPPSGSTFPAGSTTVTFTAVDGAGNSNSCQFTVTVVDGEAPLVACRPAPNPSGKIHIPGKDGTTTNNPSGYYQLLAKDNCDPNPLIYVHDTGSSLVAGPFHDGDVVHIRHTGGTARWSLTAPPVTAAISLNGNGVVVAKDAGNNETPTASGCTLVP